MMHAVQATYGSASRGSSHKKSAKFRPRKLNHQKPIVLGNTLS